MLHLEKGLFPFWDDSLIDRRFSNAVLSSNRAERREVVFQCDLPWEGNQTDFFTIVKDDGFYRMYYEGWSLPDPEKAGISVCYAESRDGLHWEKPDLGLVEFRGSKHNNIVLRGIHDNFTVMKDPNPACPPELRYKALLQIKEWDLPGYRNTIPDPGKGFLLGCMVSPDGLHWEKYAVVSRGFTYDSMNTLHWNERTGRYVAFFRTLHDNPEDPASTCNETLVRAISMAESEDMIHWSEPKPLDFGAGEDYPLYTNCVSHYPDSPYFIGFPTRYVERKAWTKNYDRLSGAEARRERMKANPRYGLAITDCVFMCSRDGLHWYRFDEASITPGPENGTNWVYGDCYPSIGGFIEVPGSHAGEPSELSFFLEGHRWASNDKVELVRYAFRRDGFASVKADYAGKTLRTKPFTFDGGELHLNFRTSARGSVYLSILDERNLPIEGYTTCELFGDSVDRTIDFDKPLADLAGRIVRFDFRMRDAELYALRFV